MIPDFIFYLQIVKVEGFDSSIICVLFASRTGRRRPSTCGRLLSQVGSPIRRCRRMTAPLRTPQAGCSGRSTCGASSSSCRGSGTEEVKKIIVKQICLHTHTSAIPRRLRVFLLVYCAFLYQLSAL